MHFKGVAAAPGMVLAPCLKLLPLPEPETGNQAIGPEQAEAERSAFETALQTAALQLTALRERAEADGDSARSGILDAQGLMLKDPLLAESVREKITNLLRPAVWAVREAIDEQAAILDGLADPLFRERAADVRDIGRRILACLTRLPEADPAALKKEVILVGREIAPSLLASLDAAFVKGIVAETGGKTSHAAILAKHRGIVAVFGCQGIVAAVSDGEALLVDGDSGRVEAGIPPEREPELRAEIYRRRHFDATLRSLAELPTRTRDGCPVGLAANVMNAAEAAEAARIGADGVGLFRTESLFLGRVSAPTEEEQFRAYAETLQAMRGKPVIFRTLDIGGDKEVPYLNLPREQNPFLGYRAIRVCLQDRPLFLAQLRAILRAGVHGEARLMYPMIASLEELREANRALQEAKDSLSREGIPFAENLRAGVMVEVPAAAATADLLIREAEFFSIGSNDLTQYVLAADRMNARVGRLYDHFHPGLLRLVRMVIEAVHGAGGRKFAGMCGEMAADPLAVPLLLGLGLTEFSVDPSSLLKTKKIITSIDSGYARQIAGRAMELETAEEVRGFLRETFPGELRECLWHVERRENAFAEERTMT